MTILHDSISRRIAAVHARFGERVTFTRADETELTLDAAIITIMRAEWRNQRFTRDEWTLWPLPALCVRLPGKVETVEIGDRFPYREMVYQVRGRETENLQGDALVTVLVAAPIGAGVDVLGEPIWFNYSNDKAFDNWYLEKAYVQTLTSTYRRAHFDPSEYQGWEEPALLVSVTGTGDHWTAARNIRITYDAGPGEKVYRARDIDRVKMGETVILTRVVFAADEPGEPLSFTDTLAATRTVRGIVVPAEAKWRDARVDTAQWWQWPLPHWMVTFYDPDWFDITPAWLATGCTFTRDGRTLTVRYVEWERHGDRVAAVRLLAA